MKKHTNYLVVESLGDCSKNSIYACKKSQRSLKFTVILNNLKLNACIVYTESKSLITCSLLNRNGF